MKTRIMTFALLATVVCGGCGDALNEASTLSVIHDAAMVKAGIVDTVAQYRAAARQGDGHAYLALARCYWQGKGVDRNFLMAWQMARMAVQYGGIASVDDFYDSLPADDPFRLLIEAMDDVDNQQHGEALRKADLLEAHSPSDADLIRGAVAIGEGRREEALALLDNAAAEGNILAEMAIRIVSEGQEAIYRYAEQMPSLYCQMARECFTTDFDPDEDARAAALYRKADEHLCLDGTGVRWLLGYCEHQAQIEGTPVDSAELQRLRIISRQLADSY